MTIDWDGMLSRSLHTICYDSDVAGGVLGRTERRAHRQRPIRAVWATGVGVAGGLAVVAVLLTSGQRQGKPVESAAPPSALTIEWKRDPRDPLVIHWHGATIGTTSHLTLVSQVRDAGRWVAFESGPAEAGFYEFSWRFVHHSHPKVFVVRVLLPGEPTRGHRAVVSPAVRVPVA